MILVRGGRALAPLLAIGILCSDGARAASEPPSPLRVGEETLARRETPHPVPLVEADAPAWRDVFTWPHASYIAVHFSGFSLAPGERVVISTPDGARRYTLVGEGKPLTGGTFWAPHVPGDTCIVTYHGNGMSPGFGYVVDRFAHGDPPSPVALLFEEPPSIAALCGADDSREAKCYEQSEPLAYDKSRAVVRLLIDGVTFCTGWLVGCEGHVMTNAHCITSAGEAADTDFELMAEGASCAAKCFGPFACPGIVEANTSTLVKRDLPRDYALVLPPVNVSGSHGFLKMRPSGAVANERIYVPGYPAGWGKRLALESSHLDDESGRCEVFSLDAASGPCQSGGPPDVDYFCDTQGGSSGSPVIASSDNRVVALHHCAPCPNRAVPIQEIIADLAPDLPRCAIQQLQGTVSFDADRYPCSGSSGVRVVDDSLAGAGFVSVAVRSTTEPTPETVTLAESVNDPGVFTGSVVLTADPPVGEDGRVSLSDEDVLTVEYIDGDDGEGGTNVLREDTAAIDCVPPLISGVSATGVTGSAATIVWTTSEPATSVVHYGPEPPGALTLTASSGARVTAHAQPLAGLSQCAAYEFAVESRDEAGNVASDDNGGASYTFTTGPNIQPSFSSTDTPIPIPDDDPAGASSTIVVTDDRMVADVDVTVDLTHSFDGDLVLALITPTGQSITLSNRRGAGGFNFSGTVFDDEAPTPIASGNPPYFGSFQPEEPLSAADGIGSAGAWRLEVVDEAFADTGTIESWTLTLSYPPFPCGPFLQYVSSSIVEGCRVGGPGDGDGVVDPGEDVFLPVMIRNSGTSGATGVAATLSTTTLGIVVTQHAASYPDVPQGAQATSDSPHFAFTVATGVQCGTTAEFTVTAQANEGSWSQSFSIPIGLTTTDTVAREAENLPVPIPDEGTVVSAVSVPEPGLVTDVNVRVVIAHARDSDLDIVLMAPDGTPVELSTDNGGDGPNYLETVFDDEASASILSGSPPFTGAFLPESPLAALDGGPAAGVWTLEIGDDEAQETGELLAWSLTVGTVSGPTCRHCASPAPTRVVRALRWTGGVKTELLWEPSQGASYYILYRGALPTLPLLLDDNTDSCRRAITVAPGTGNILEEVPAAGTLWWYLVRPANGAGEGPIGEGTAGPRVLDAGEDCF